MITLSCDGCETFNFRCDDCKINMLARRVRKPGWPGPDWTVAECWPECFVLQRERATHIEGVVTFSLNWEVVS